MWLALRRSDLRRADRIKTATQLDAAFDFIARGGGDEKAFAEATGIGVVVTPEQVRVTVGCARESALPPPFLPLVL